jgi:O-antigen ligase
VAGLLAVRAVDAVGIAAAIAPFVLGALALMLVRPWLALTSLGVIVVLFEEDPRTLFPSSAAIHRQIPGLPLSAVDALVVVVLVAVALDVVRTRRPFRLPAGLLGPLVLLALAAAFGLVVGLSGGADLEQVKGNTLSLLGLLVLPFAVVNLVVDRRDVERVILGVVVLGAIKGIEGVLIWGTGRGPQVGGESLTFLGPAANWITLLVVLGVLAFALMGGRLTVPLLLVGVVCTASFALSFRRNFWIGAVVAVVLVLVAVRGGRVARVVAVLALAAALALVAFTGVAGNVQGPLVERVESLSPAKVQASTEDRYRLDELDNVSDELANHPITGLGIGVAWTGRHPLSEQHPGGEFYAHVAALWFWLKLGIFGLVGYLWLVGAEILTATRVARRGPSSSIRAAGVAVAAGTVALALAETTGTFTGVEQRFNIVLGLLLGALAAAYQLPPASPAADIGDPAESRAAAVGPG